MYNVILWDEADYLLVGMNGFDLPIDENQARRLTTRSFPSQRVEKRRLPGARGAHDGGDATGHYLPRHTPDEILLLPLQSEREILESDLDHRPGPDVGVGRHGNDSGEGQVLVLLLQGLLLLDLSIRVLEDLTAGVHLLPLWHVFLDVFVSDLQVEPLVTFGVILERTHHFRQFTRFLSVLRR